MTGQPNIAPGSLCHFLLEQAGDRPLGWWQLLRLCRGHYPDSPRVRTRVRTAVRLLVAYGCLAPLRHGHVRTPAGDALLSRLGREA